MTLTQDTPIEVKVAIVGSGFSGLGTAIRLRQEGIEDFVVLERGDDVGGTWHYNTYPGAACDIPSHLYSFSFAPTRTGARSTPRSPRSATTCAAPRTSSASGRSCARAARCGARAGTRTHSAGSSTRATGRSWRGSSSPAPAR